MGLKQNTLCALLTGASLLSYNSQNTAATAAYDARENQQQELIFVFEMIRHGARSHYENNIDSNEFFGVPQGHLTGKGRIEQTKIGRKRAEQYIRRTKLLPVEYQEESILMISTFKERCRESGHKLLQGLYPLTNFNFTNQTEYIRNENSPLNETTYETILAGILAENGGICHSGPILQVPTKLDISMHTRNCPNVHKYLNNDHFDTVGLEERLIQTFGQESVTKLKQILADKFEEFPQDLRAYFNLLDAQIAEMYHLGASQKELAPFTEQECFILANNFYGPDPDPAKIYLSRMLLPIWQILKNVVSNSQKNLEDPLKYLVLNLHDTNVSNFLRMLGYWEAFGYTKYTRFSSSVRLELIKEKQLSTENTYYIRIIYDNEVLNLPWCVKKSSQYLCTFEEFDSYFSENLFTDPKFIEQFCLAQIGTDYINMEKRMDGVGFEKNLQ